jgi:hypothetical protein
MVKAKKTIAENTWNPLLSKRDEGINFNPGGV